MRGRRVSVIILLALIFYVYDCAASRSSFRSSRFSYRSYRAPSYRSYRTFRASSYTVTPVVMRRMGGIGMSNKMLLAAGSVYVAYKLRPTFHVGGYYRYNNDDFAICSGNFSGWNERNQTVIYKYFVCPTDIGYIIRWDDRKYCCGPTNQQHCCDKEAFYMQYGVAVTGVSVAVIATACVLSVLFLCGCCGLLLYCKFRGRMRSAHQRPLPVPTEDPSMKAAGGAPAYPMQPAWEAQAASAYPPAAVVGYSPYPPPLPGGPSDAPPYPTYQQPGGAPPPNLPPPAYPGPM